MNLSSAHGIFVRSSVVGPHTLHCIDLNTSETTSLGEQGWFPVYHSPLRLLAYLQTPIGGADSLRISEIVDDELRVIATLNVSPDWSGPPFTFDAAGNILIRTMRDEGSVTVISPGGEVLEVGRISIPPTTRIVGLHTIADRPAVLLMDDVSHHLDILDGDLSTSWSTDAMGGILMDDKLVVLSSDCRTVSIRPAISPDVVEGHFDISGYTTSRQPDWWRPIQKVGDYLAVGIGVDTLMINVRSGWMWVIDGGIHMLSTQLSSDVEASDIGPREVAGRVDEVPPDGPQRSVGSLAVGSKVLRYGLRGWSENFPVLLFSGCPWSATGGAQRPVAIARKLSAMGRPVFYYSSSDQVSGFVDGVTIISKQDFPSFRDHIIGARGVAVCCFPSFHDDYLRLTEAGWSGIYDMLDDWDGMARRGEVEADVIALERNIISASDFITCSCGQLVDRARFMGADGDLIRLIMNGGPDIPYGPYIPPADMMTSSPIVAIYSGYTAGSWFDWECLERINEDESICTNIVGGLSARVLDRVRFIGERSYPQAREYIGAAHVGIIPFRDEGICHAVDPIKAYDYWAAGLWVVSTPVIEPMVDRPYSLTAVRGRFSEAIAEAAQRRLDNPIPDEYVVENSWTRRAQEMDDVMSIIKPRRTHQRVTVVERPHLGENESNLRLTLQFPAGCNMDPACPYCANRSERDEKSASFVGSINDWLESLRWLEVSHGPLHITSCYGEPLSDIGCVRLFADLSRSNLFDLVTNLVAPLEVIDILPKNGNARLATSFHPHFWQDIHAFLAKRQAVRDMGIHCGITLIVAYPPYLNKLDGWKRAVEAVGGTVEILPFYGTFRGKSYPQDYTDVERLVVLGEQNKFYNRRDASIVRYTRGVPCWAGCKYIYVHWNGDIHTCPSPFSPRIGNLLERNVRMEVGPTPCEADYCGCSDLWRYIVEDDLDDGATDTPRRG